MVISDIQHIFEAWAPPSIAWEKDNVGLQIGSPGKKVRSILVALDITDSVIEESRKKHVDLIICHHPLLFKPVRTINENDRIGRMIQQLIRHNIALYTAHTNLDFTTGGVSFALAERLGILNPSILLKNHRIEKKIVTFVPREHVDATKTAMAHAGAGEIGDYSSCSFQTEGMGTFRGSDKTKPYAGNAGQLEQVEEIRLEMIVPDWKLPTVISALRSNHPYEEPAYDIFPLDNTSAKYGSGAIGALERPITLRQLLKNICTVLKTPQVRYSGKLHSTIRTVAVCGGSGSDLVTTALQQHADAFVTADIRYHSFEEPDGAMALIDAGHFETEVPAIQTIVRTLQRHPAIKKEKITVASSRSMKNPVQYFLS